MTVTATALGPDAPEGEETLPIVREKVRELLLRNSSYQALPQDARVSLAHDMVSVANAIVGGGLPGGVVPTSATMLAAGENVPGSATPDLRPGDEHVSGRPAQLGTDQFGRLVEKVDFPSFVSGLIDGVFNAIVSASIQQMEAYGELLKNVVKSVDEYMRDNISENQARDHLAERYPDHLEVDTSGETPQLKPKEDADDASMPDFLKDLNLPFPIDTLDETAAEEVLVPAARRRMALDRQQLLATMVLMGINRLIVTDGTIQASVIFELATREKLTQSGTAATQFDERVYERPGFWGWFAPRYTRSGSSFNVTTTRSEASSEEINMKAKLMGNVNVRFRSETFPLERMGDIIQPRDIAAKAPAAAGAQPVEAPIPTPVAPPLPPIPGATPAPGR
jgi:hypothetical protein